MPRLPTSLILKARKISPLLPLVLQGTRTLNSAINELRWMKEHLQESSKFSKSPTCPGQTRERFLKLCQRRARSEPLQYILGSQPFGELDIKCRPGVLIPRPETEAYTNFLAKTITKNLEVRSSRQHLLKGETTLRILDVCSGTGCISLLLHNLLYKRVSKVGKLDITGIDISEDAIILADDNLVHNLGKGLLERHAAVQVRFIIRDFLQEQPSVDPFYQIIVSNPPYISLQHFNTETTRSVRNWEPKLALVPPQNELTEWDPADVFYARLIQYYEDRCSRMLVMEVGDEAQALRIITRAMHQYRPLETSLIQIWRDWPDQYSSAEEKEWCAEFDGTKLVVLGTGKIRAVVFKRRRTVLKTIEWKKREMDIKEKSRRKEVGSKETS